MSETGQRLTRSCLSITIVIGIFLLILLIIGIGVLLYSIQVGSL